MKNKILLVLLVLFAGAAIYAIFFRNSKPETEELPIANPQFPEAKPMAVTSSVEHLHDTGSYTEGLEFYKDYLYESAGQKGKSFLAKYPLSNLSKPFLKKLTDTSIFAEGITILHDTLYQLTYQNNIVFLYNATTLEKIGSLPWFDVTVEGWGLTNNGKQLIASTGSNIIYFLNPKDLKIERTINVKINGTPAEAINELEYVDGFIYANQFTTDNILKIDDATGHVIGIANFKNLLPGYDAYSISQKTGKNDDNEKYLNGIAYQPKTGTFFITGKNWPKIFEVRF
jgi:glutamine cyclotransferase